MVTTPSLSVARRPRDFVRVAGPDAEDYLQRMLSNDVVALDKGSSCDALLLTAKSRVIAPLRVLRRDLDDFLLLTEPGLGERVVTELVRMRFAAKAQIEMEEHASYVVLGREEGGIENADYGVAAVEILDADPPPVPTLEDEELEAMRIAAGTPAWGKELDEGVLPAEAGLDESHISFTKGCFPGQEPIARLHYRGHVNRRLRVLEVDAAGPGAEITWEGKPVGRVTSAASGLALGYVRAEVPREAVLDIDGRTARMKQPHE
jgi:tRNA-modifying protein YgfZ